MNKYKIQSKWCLWYHSINDNKWTKDSYKKIININNLLDYHFLKKNFERQHLQNGMFFIMRDDIFPTWEDPDNIEGCCISFKLTGSNIKNDFFNILKTCISENIMKDNKKYNLLNGISISPKKEFNITKIWIKDDSKDYKGIVKEYGPLLIEKSIYKKHELSY